MTTHEPSKLALSALNRLALDNAPLAGDLLEEFRRGSRTSLWLWHQLLQGMVRHALYAPHPPIALNLTPVDPIVAQWLMEKRLYTRRRVNLTGSGIEGIGGLTMVILGFIVTMVIPAVWWFVVGGLVAGGVCGVAMVKLQKRSAIETTRPLNLL